MCSSPQQNFPRMAVGDRFASSTEFSVALEVYEQATKQKFWRRSSHRIEKANVKRTLKKELEFYDMHYFCIHGGLRFKPRGKGERRTSTHKMDCPANIKLLASSCGNFLEIRSVELQHENHELSSSVFEHLPHNRRLAPSERAEAQVLLNLGCDRKKLQNKIATETNKHPTLKDLTNIVSTMRREDENELAKAVSLLEEKYRANVQVLRDGDNNFKGLYFSTEDMRNSMSSWPEIVLIDGTYNLLVQDFTLMLFLVEHSNGLSEVAGVGLIVHEDRETFEWLLECFKSDNEAACTKINCFMADKDLLERDVLRDVFGVPIYICLFHTLKTFSRQITTDRMGSSNPTKRQEVLRLLQGLVYSTSEEDYDKKYANLCAEAPSGVLQYYDKNWHPIKDEWTVYSMVHGNLKNQTNNRLESINNKIKQVVPKRSTLKSFIDHFFEWLRAHKYERDHKAAQHVLKRPITVFAPDTCEDRYLRKLTSFAFGHVIESIERSKLIKAEDITEDGTGSGFVIKGRKGTVNTTSMTCQCSFWTSMLLPCKHIFAIRQLEELSLFDEQLIGNRWTQEYYLENQRTFRSKSNPATPPTSPAPAVTETKRQRPLTLYEKRKRASLITSSLVTLASLSSKGHFLCKLQVLKDIERFWREGLEVTVEKIEKRSSGSIVFSTLVDSEDEGVYEPDYDTRPLQTIRENLEDVESSISTGDCNTQPCRRSSESSGDVDCDASSLDSVLVFDWDTDYDVDELNDYLQMDNSIRQNITFDVQDIITPPPESVTVGTRLIGGSCEKQKSSPEAIDAASMANFYTDSAARDNLAISQISGAATTVAEVYVTVGSLENPASSLEAEPPTATKTNSNFVTRDSSAMSQIARVPTTITEVQPTTAVIQKNSSSAGAETGGTSSLFLDHPKSTHETNAILREIIMPGPIRVHGRPKGAVLTAIGLTRRRQTDNSLTRLNTGNSVKAPVEFTKRPVKDQVESILSWCVPKDIIPDVLSGEYLVRESDVVRPELIKNSILDEKVSLHLLQDFMDAEAFERLISIIHKRRETVVWECSVCTEKLKGKSIICDACLTWYHYKCVGVKRAPRELE